MAPQISAPPSTAPHPARPAEPGCSPRQSPGWRAKPALGPEIPGEALGGDVAALGQLAELAARPGVAVLGSPRPQRLGELGPRAIHPPPPAPGGSARSSRGPPPKLRPAASESVRASQLSNVTVGCPTPSTPPSAKPPMDAAFGAGTRRALPPERAASPCPAPLHCSRCPLPAPEDSGRQPGLHARPGQHPQRRPAWVGSPWLGGAPVQSRVCGPLASGLYKARGRTLSGLR